MILILLGLKYSTNLTAAFFLCLYCYSHKRFYSLPEIAEKMYIKIKFQKTEFDKYDTSGVSAFSITSIYLIQFIVDQNYHNNC